MIVLEFSYGCKLGISSSKILLLSFSYLFSLSLFGSVCRCPFVYNILLPFSFTSNVALHLVSISSTFYARVFCTKVLFSSYILAKKALLYEKRVRKMLIKLTPALLAPNRNDSFGRNDSSWSLLREGRYGFSGSIRTSSMATTQILDPVFGCKIMTSNCHIFT